MSAWREGQKEQIKHVDRKIERCGGRTRGGGTRSAARALMEDGNGGAKGGEANKSPINIPVPEQKHGAEFLCRASGHREHGAPIPPLRSASRGRSFPPFSGAEIQVSLF